MPKIALASECHMPMAGSAMQKMASSVTQNDDASCWIRCGCNCNQDVDGLPHLLSPHLFSTQVGLPYADRIAISTLHISTKYSYIPSVPLPPPDLS